MRHLVGWEAYQESEIRRILEIAVDLKKLDREGNRPPVLERKVIGLLFEKPSLRTRVSFECLANQTGASSLFLGEDVGWGKREPIQDFVPILTSYIDCLVIRSKSHDAVTQAIKYSRCPIINGLTDYSHPCQALADVMTLEELFEGMGQLRVAYVGDANNVAFSLGLICIKLGIEFHIAGPQGYRFNEQQRATLMSEASAGKLFFEHQQPQDAVQGAHAVYTDVWTSMGQESEAEKRRAAFAEYQVNEALFQFADPNARFLHCLPARRGEEVDSEVIDSDRSAIVLQAENRLHAQKGLVVWMLTEAEKNQ